MLRSPVSSLRRSPVAARSALAVALLAGVVPAWTIVLLSGHAAGTDRAVHGAGTLLISGLILVLGAGVARAGWTRRDARTMIGSFAIGTAAVLLVGQALALLSSVPADAASIRLSGLLVIPGSAGVLALARVRTIVRPGRELVVLRTGVITIAITATIAIAAALIPGLVPLTIPARSEGGIALFALTTVLVGLLARVALRTLLLTRRPLDAAALIGLLWLIPAHYALATSLPGEVRWAAGHGLQFSGFLLLSIQVAADLSRTVRSAPLTGGLQSSALVDRSAEFLGARVTALVDRLADKDPTTHGHVQRVAMLAVQMGEHLHLPVGRLRLLAAGGLLHDIGKLAVPSEVLSKPAALTEEEFAVVQRHPSDGAALLSELGGFHELVLQLVESHHERIDGSGYPHGRVATELPLEVRILAVADVFDALTADRPYRRAVSAFDALSELSAQAGSGLDERCVGALRQVLDREQLAEIGQRVRGSSATPLPRHAARLRGANASADGLL